MLAQMTSDPLVDPLVVPLDEALASSGATAAAELVEFDAEQARANHFGILLEPSVAAIGERLAASAVAWRQ